MPAGSDNHEQPPVEPLPVNLSTDEGPRVGVSPRGRELSGAKVAAGRGSIISCNIGEVSPGTGHNQSQEQAESGPSQTDNLDSRQANPATNDSLEANESDGAQVPVWSDLIHLQTSDLTGLILKPAGVQEKMKKASDRPKDTWPDGKRVYQNLVESYSMDAAVTESSRTSHSSTFSEDLERNCFDEIPPRSQAKTVSHDVEPFLDFSCVSFGNIDSSLPDQEAGQRMSSPDVQVTSDTSVLGKVSRGTVPYGSKVGRTRFSEPSPTGISGCNVNIPYPYMIESQGNLHVKGLHPPEGVLCLTGTVPEGTSGSSHSDQHPKTGQVSDVNTQSSLPTVNSLLLQTSAQGGSRVTVSQPAAEVAQDEPCVELAETFKGTPDHPQNMVSKLQLLLQLVKSGNQPVTPSD